MADGYFIDYDAEGLNLQTAAGGAFPSGNNVGANTGRCVMRVYARTTPGTYTVTIRNASGTITQEVEFTVVEYTAPLQVSSTTVSIPVGGSEAITVSGGVAPYIVTSTDTSIATVSPETLSEPGDFTITGVGIGTCTVTVSDAALNHVDITVTAVPACPTINAMTLDMGSILSGGTGIVDHYDFGDFGTPGTMPYIYVQTATASDSAVDVYVKVTYPDARSAWLYEEAGAMIYHDPTVTPNPEYSGQVFSEGTVLPILTWWFNPAYEDLTNAETGGYELPDGTYTWDIYLLPAGTSISNPDDVAANACASATASVTLTTDRP